MAGNNFPKGGNRPPSVIAAPAAPVEPVSPVVAAVPAPVHVEPAKAAVAPAAAPSEGPKQGAFDALGAVTTFVRLAAQPEPASPESQALAPAAIAPGLPAVPADFELAMWLGAGRFAGPFYTFPDRAERQGCLGKTLGYFPSASVTKLKGMFERCDAPAVGETMPTATPNRPPGAEEPPPPGFLLARWTSRGRFAGAFLTFPERKEQPFAMGPTLGYFPAPSVVKLKEFERV